jgi:hypothetical protein
MKNMMMSAARMTAEPNIMNPKDKKRCWNSLIVAALLSCGPFKAIITDPTWLSEEIVEIYGIRGNWPAVSKNVPTAAPQITYYAQEASNPPKEGERLFEEYGREDGTDDNGECPQWRDDDSWYKRIAAEVAYFSKNHHNHPWS